MIMKKTPLNWLIALCLVWSAMLLAQPPKPRRGGGPPPDQQQGFVPGERRPGPDSRRPAPPPGDQSFRFLSMDMRAGGKTVKSAPFSATAETEFVQRLGNGSTITRKSSALLYRDSEGRTRRDQTLSHVGPFATGDDTPQIVFINDPVAGVNYLLDPRQRTVRKMPSRGGPPPDRSESRAPMGKPSNAPSNSEAQTEALGKQIIEGVEAEGTRSTITIPVGKIGNDQPLEIVSERWYSPVLQEVILSKHSDPRYGINTYRLKNINRTEPSASLFQPPADYTQKEERGFKPPRREDK
jgi:hypothetical protein